MPDRPFGAACDACGCPATGQDEQRCDAVDEDGDRFVDEGLDCEPIPLASLLDARVARRILEHVGKPARAPPEVPARDPPPFWASGVDAWQW